MSMVAELAGLEDEREVSPETEDTRLAASGTRVDAMAGAIAPIARRHSARLRTHRLEGSVVAVVFAWAIVGGLTAVGWL